MSVYLIEFGELLTVMGMSKWTVLWELHVYWGVDVYYVVCELHDYEFLASNAAINFSYFYNKT